MLPNRFPRKQPRLDGDRGVTCDQARLFLFDYLDGELGPEAQTAFLPDVEGCRVCSLELAACRRSTHALRSARPIAPPAADMLAEFHSRLDASRSRRSPWALWRVAMPALAVGVCAAGMLAIGMFRSTVIPAPARDTGLARGGVDPRRSLALGTERSDGARDPEKAPAPDSFRVSANRSGRDGRADIIARPRLHSEQPIRVADASDLHGPDVRKTPRRTARIVDGPALKLNLAYGDAIALDTTSPAPSARSRMSLDRIARLADAPASSFATPRTRARVEDSPSAGDVAGSVAMNADGAADAWRAAKSAAQALPMSTPPSPPDGVTLEVQDDARGFHAAAHIAALEEVRNGERILTIQADEDAPAAGPAEQH